MLAYKVFLCLYFSSRYRIRHLRGFLEFKKAYSQSEQVFSISFHFFPVFDLVWKCLAPMSGGVSTCTSSGLSESHPVFARPLTAPYLSPVKYMDSFSPTALPSFSTEGSLGGWHPSTVEPLSPYFSLATNGTPVNIVTQQRNETKPMTRSKNIVKAQLICFWPPLPAASVPPGQPSSKESLPFSPWRPGDAYRWFGIMED